MGAQGNAAVIVEQLGTKENLLSIENCMTRVRITVKDVKKCDIDKLKKLDDILGVNVEGNHVQLVVGPGKSAKLATQMSEITGIKTIEGDEAELRK